MVLMVGISATAGAWDHDSDTFEITANIVRPLELETLEDIDFGLITGEIGVRTEEAEMRVTGTAGEEYEVNWGTPVEGNQVVIDQTNGDGELVVDLNVEDVTPIGENSEDYFNVVATIDEANNAPIDEIDGDYSEEVIIEVTYAD